MKYLNNKIDEEKSLETIKQMELQLAYSPNYDKKGSVSFYQMMAETYRFLDSSIKKEQELFGVTD